MNTGSPSTPRFQRLLILGGAGRVGRQLIELALARGHHVTALVRSPEKLSGLAHANLKVFPGDVRDAGALKVVLEEGQDAVLCTLGIFQREPGTPLADMTQTLLSCLQTHGPKRLVVMSSLGAGDSRGQGDLLVKLIQRLRLKYVLIDKDKQESLIRASRLDWTILRPPRLLNRGDSAPYQVWQSANAERPPRWQISTRDAAAEMLNLLQKDNSIGQAYQCSY